MFVYVPIQDYFGSSVQPFFNSGVDSNNNCILVSSDNTNMIITFATGINNIIFQGISSYSIKFEMYTIIDFIDSIS